MKLKRIACMLAVAMLLSTTAIHTAFADETGSGERVMLAEHSIEYKAPEDAIAALDLKNPCEVDENGNISLESGDLIDLILPKELDGQNLTSISAKSFAGCPYIRSVVIPETILEIGDGAFADCEFLETIYVIGHNEDDLTLGDNWNGDAEVRFVVDEAEEKEDPAAEDANKAEEKTPEDVNKGEASADEQPSDKADVKNPDDPTKENAGTEEKTPAEENGSDEEKQPASEQPTNGEDGSGSSDATGTVEPQGNEGVDNESHTNADASAEGSAVAEN